MGDLVDVIIDYCTQKYGFKKDTIKKTIIGPRPGEKKYEELLTESEAKKVFETQDMLIIPPQIEFPDMKYETSDYPNAQRSTYSKYTSRDIQLLSKEEIKTLLFG
jgi:FlaA1/EpsC-like NDP-sugar epimerase